MNYRNLTFWKFGNFWLNSYKTTKNVAGYRILWNYEEISNFFETNPVKNSA